MMMLKLMMLVSIPYRLATNRIYCVLVYCCTFWFQFLIGWLQTKHLLSPFVYGAYEFQFLIGWLQTDANGINIIKIEFEFQFLIGWLQTS